MKYELFDFQENAAKDLLKKMSIMQKHYKDDDELSAVALTAPTGAGKTVISSAVIEGLFYGNEYFNGDENAAVLWLSDSPALNAQTLKRFDESSDLLGKNQLVTVTSEFAKNHRKLSPGKVYFLNRQLLSKSGKLVNENEGSRTFYDILSETIDDPYINLYLIIDEAHRGLGNRNTKNADQTIYSKLIDGQEGKNPPMPAVVGISATPKRFQNVMAGRKDRDIKSEVSIPVSKVRESGLIKDTIELRTPKKAEKILEQDLKLACRKLEQSQQSWKKYCVANGVTPITPLMVVQVEDRISDEKLNEICRIIHKQLPDIDTSKSFANVFGEHIDRKVGIYHIPYILPENVSEETDVCILFAKDAISTGWDCPRAEVLYSRRKRNDPTYIAQLIGRMIRNPLAKRIGTNEELNSVVCYLPEFDSSSVDLVVDRLKEDTVASATDVIKNPVDLSYYGNSQTQLENQLKDLEEKQRTSGQDSNNLFDNGTMDKESRYDQQIGPKHSFVSNQPEDFATSVSVAENNNGDFENNVEVDPGERDSDSIEAEINRIKEIKSRMPQADPEAIKSAFESIVTRQIRRTDDDKFHDLWVLQDAILEDIEGLDKFEKQIKEEFFNNLNGEIQKHPALFNRAKREIMETQIAVKRIDPLTGEEFEDREEIVTTDSQRMDLFYKKAKDVFGGNSDLIKSYINQRMDDGDSKDEAIARVSAAASTLEIVRGMEEWAEKKIVDLLDDFSPLREQLSEENQARWDSVAGNALPFIEKKLNINATVASQSKENPHFEKHIIQDSEGWTYQKLKPLECKIVNSELKRPATVGWYRNVARNLNGSLGITYKLYGEYNTFYPDFIFFSKGKNGEVTKRIVDPHGDWLGDSVAKLQGYVDYLKAHPDIFASVLAITEVKNGECRYLDLTNSEVQRAVEEFKGDSARDLFEASFSHSYKLKE